LGQIQITGVSKNRDDIGLQKQYNYFAVISSGRNTMTRLRRYCPGGIPVHIIQRGNNRSDCFHEEPDKGHYFLLLKAAADSFDLRVHAWVFMSNHVHLLVTPVEADSVSRMMQFVDREYVRYFNRKYSRTGTLWDGRFKSCLVQAERYFLICQRYIELNPVRARLVKEPASFHWSSFNTNALGIDSNLIIPHEVYLALGNTQAKRLLAYRALFNETMPAKQISKIRFALNKGLVLGSKKFKDRIAKEGGQRTRLGRRGRKPSKG